MKGEGLMKRLLAMILVITMVINLVPVKSYAGGETPDWSLEIVDYGNIDIQDLWGYVNAEYGSDVTIGVNVSASETMNFQYKWYILQNSALVLMEGEEEDSISLEVTDNYAKYYCDVTDEYGKTLEACFEITIDSGLEAEAVEETVYVAKGEDAHLEVAASAKEGVEFRYEWRKYDEIGHLSNPIESADTEVYAVENVEKNEDYLCKIIDEFGNEKEVKFYVEITDEWEVSPMQDESELSVSIHDDIELAVEVDNPHDYTLTYQWFYREEMEKKQIEGAINSTYSAENIVSYMIYYCEITDEYGHTKTVDFHVSPEVEWYLSSDGNDQIYVNEYESATMSVLLEGIEENDVIYQWYVYAGQGNWTEIKNANSSSYIAENIKIHQEYACGVTDSYGNYKQIEFDVYIKPTWVAEAKDRIYIDVPVNGQSTMSVVVEGADDIELSYQWYCYNKDGEYTEIEGANTSDYILKNAMFNTKYSCRITDEYGTTQVVTFYIEIKKEWEAEPVGGDEKIVEYADDVTLSIKVTAPETQELTYQWYKYDDENGYEIIQDANTISYTVKNVTKYVSYLCEVVDVYGNVSEICFSVAVKSEWDVYPDGGEDKTIQPGQDITLNVKTDAPQEMQLTYKWYFYDTEEGSIAIEDAQSSSFTLKDILSNGEYYCKVTDIYGNTKEVWFYIWILADWKVEAVGNTEVVVPKKEDTTLQVRVITEEDLAFTYKWYKYSAEIGSQLVAEGTTSLTVESVTENLYYFCKIQDQYGNEEKVYYDVIVDYGWNAKAKDGDRKLVSFNEKTTLEVLIQSEEDRELTYKWYTYDENDDIKILQKENLPFFETEPITYAKMYYCDVTDVNQGEMFTVYFYVRVAYSWKLKTPDIVDMVVAKQDVLNLSFLIDNPKEEDIKYTWYVSTESGYKQLDNVRGSECVTDPITENAYYYCMIVDNYGNSISVDYYITVDPDKKHTHNYGECKVTKNATCKEAGTKVCVCMGCGEEHQEEIPLIQNHAYGEFKVIKESTCKEAGTKVQTCSVCGKENTETIPMIANHIYSDWKVLAEPTCDKEGVKERTCVVCNGKETSPIAAKGYVKGAIFTKGNYIYKIKTQKGKKGTVVCEGSAKNLKSVTIPKSVKAGGVTFTVVEIAEGAFKGDTKLSSVVIGAEITKIGREAFSGCKKLKKVTIKSSKLKSVGKNAIKGIHKKTTIKVPSDRMSKYKKLFKKSTGYKNTMKFKKGS